MKSTAQLTDQEQYQLKLLRRDFETCADILDRYFSPGEVSVHEALRKRFKLSKQSKSTVVSNRLLGLLVILPIVAVIFFATWGYLSELRPNASEYTLRSVYRVTVDDENLEETEPIKNFAKININSAATEALTALPGIGPVIAQRIVDERTSHGEFHYPEDLLSVSGIGAKTLARITPYLSFSEP